MVKTKLVAGVIGLGVGESHIQGYDDHPLCSVSKICDFDRDALKTVGNRHPAKIRTPDPQNIIDDPNIDIVSIASFDGFHKEQVISSLKNGKHVFVEKPLCLTSSELDQIIENLNAWPNLQLSSNLILRMAPRFMELKGKIDTGELGQIYHLEGSYDYGRLHKLTEGWRGTVPNYSVTHGGAIHLIDLMLWLSGKKAVSVQGVGNKVPTQNSIFKGFSLTSAIIEFEDGSTAQITSNFASLAPHHHKLSVYGTSGTFEQSHLGTAYFYSREPDQSPDIVETPYPGTRKGALLYDFIESIHGNAAPFPSKQEVVDAMSVSLAIDESISSQKKETIKYPLLK